MADILDKRPVDAEMTIFKTEVEPNKLNACIDNILMRIDRLETKFADVQPVDRWISCKDKMPEEIGYYLVVIGNEMLISIDIAEYSEGYWHIHDKVLYWQPLPELPKEG